MKIAMVALAYLLAASGAGQDKVTLKFRPRQGDKVTHVQKMTTKVKLTVDAGGQKVELDVEQRELEKRTSHVLAVAGDKITKAFFHVEEHVEEKKPPGAPDFVRAEKPLHGRKVTVEMKDGKPVYEGADGLTDKEKKQLDLDDEFAKTFPDKALAVGDTWQVSGDALRAIFDDEKMDGKMVGKLLEVKDFGGRRSAFLETEFDLKGIVEEKIEIAAKLKGTVVVWLDRGYTLQVNLKGTMSMRGKAEGAEMSGQGPMTLDVAVTVH